MTATDSRARFPVRSCALALAVALCAAAPAQAVVIDSLPYNNSPDWTVIVFAGTSMTLADGATTLTTANDRGVWFGNGSNYGDTPAWSHGTNDAGNYLSLTLQFSANARDWSAYLYDRTHTASFAFAPTGCNGNAGSCYGATPYAGVDLLHAAPGDPTQPATTRVPLTLTDTHTFEWLLKAGQVSYRIDGEVVYAGPALVSPQTGWIAANGFLLVGDGSGSTRTGTGSMTVRGISVDTAPSAMTLVPEPASVLLWAAGLLGLAAAVRQRRRV
jgi:hypothetical protein